MLAFFIIIVKMIKIHYSPFWPKRFLLEILSSLVEISKISITSTFTVQVFMIIGDLFWKWKLFLIFIFSASIHWVHIMRCNIWCLHNAKKNKPHFSPYNDNNNNNGNLLDSSFMPSTGLNAWHALTHLIHPTIWDWFYYYLYFIDKETKTGRRK